MAKPKVRKVRKPAKVAKVAPAPAAPAPVAVPERMLKPVSLRTPMDVYDDVKVVLPFSGTRKQEDFLTSCIRAGILRVAEANPQIRPLLKSI